VHRHPRLRAPTGSLSTTAALALCVLVAVPLRHFGPGPPHLPEVLCGTHLHHAAVQLISEVSRTLALAVRLFGNMMSGAMIIAILLTITPFVFPV
jgi:F-type H+-transporting ATPase subunit a